MTDRADMPGTVATDDASGTRDYALIGAVLGWLGEHWQEQPSLFTGAF